MGFLQRLLSVGGKKKRKDSRKDNSKGIPTFSGSTRTLPLPQEQDAVVNRLLRSSSTHFSVIAETEYHTLPPIPHPINNVLRAPSIISSATQTDTYRVTVHRRMLHSRTEFPNANRSGSSSSSASPSRRHSLPPLTPGDKNRLARLKQDASVLSLLDIYDERGNPNSEAFSNTPARRGRSGSSLHALMGNPSTPNLSPSKVAVEESDISWADRYIREARCDPSSSSSTSTLSSLGIPVDLFKGSISPERLRLQDPVYSEPPSWSRELDVGFDSMQVERGTTEDASVILQPIAAALTSPSRRASQFFKFLSEREETKMHDRPLPDRPAPSESHEIPPPKAAPRGPRPIQPRPSLTSIDTAAALTVRDGPKQSQACVSPPPRHHSRPPPPPPAPAHYQPQVKPLRPKEAPLGHRMPFDELRNSDVGVLSARSVSARSVSVASSVHPQIETTQERDTDPYTPLPPRRASDGKRERRGVGENVPPNAPARPVRGQTRTRDRARCSKENTAPQVPKGAPHTQGACNPSISKDPSAPSNSITPITPNKNPAHAHLQAPSPPSPASSAELSPHGRQIMANIRANARKTSQGKTPRAWQPWGGNDEPLQA